MASHSNTYHHKRKSVILQCEHTFCACVEEELVSVFGHEIVSLSPRVGVTRLDASVSLVATTTLR